MIILLQLSMTLQKERAISSLKNIEDIYPLSPMQQGMLFHTLEAPESGMYVEQWRCTVYGDLQIIAFKQAWQRLVDRHAALRTAFNWAYRDEPFQVVYRHVTCSWRQYDWQNMSEITQKRELKTLLVEDRHQGFNLTQAPLIRFYLIQTAEETYQFLWSYHHLLLDGWSLAILLQEVFQFYNAFREGRELYLEVPRPYSDYITWLQHQDLSRAEVFWRQTLKGFITPTSLDIDKRYNHTFMSDNGYEDQVIQLSVETLSALRTLAQQHQLSLNTLVQGAWALTLSRYSGQEDVVFGVTVSGRPTDLMEIESMIGLFINTLPFRARVVPEMSLIAWLRVIQNQQVEICQYEYSPLVQVQKWSEVSYGQSFFESILVFESYPMRTSTKEWCSDLNIVRHPLVSRTNYPLTVVVLPQPVLTLRIVYHNRDFDSQMIVQMLTHIQTVLEGMVATPSRRLIELPLLTQAERHQLVATWNDTHAAYPQDACIHQQFEAQVARTPDAAAVVYEDQSLTYRVLNARANQLAHYLRLVGVGPDTRVGICVERSIDMMIGLLGILKAGGAYVPLEPEYPAERLGFIVSDAQIPVLVTQQKFIDRFLDPGMHLVYLDTDRHHIAQQPTHNPVSSATAENLAYVMYTSGSTGVPKGVMIPHHALSNHLYWMQMTFPLDEMGRVVQKTSFSFDASVWECFAPLLTGSQLIIARVGGHQDSSYLVELLATHHITMLKLVPSLLQMLLEEKALEACQSLQHVFCGGEVLSPMLQERFFTSCKAALHNLYGPTEATIDVTCWTCTRDSQHRRVPIGRPIANTQIYLLNPQLQPVPIGMPGELYIGGDSLARGYINRPALTAETFIPHPFSDEPGARLYQTGDLARYLPDGNIEFLGRLDSQVKIRGYRIELGEIELALEQHPAIRQAVVLAREDVPGNRRLVAYAVSRQEPLPRIHELQGFLRAKLPTYMIPAAFVWIDVLPTMSSGKVDRQALPAPSQARPALVEGFIAPRTPTEEILTGIWETLLGIESIGIHDNFFELGGHSLLAIQVLSRLRRTLHVEVPLRVLFDMPTVAGLAYHIERVPQIVQSVPTAPIQAISRERPIPVTLMQEHLWALDQLLPGAPFSNMTSATRLTGALNVAALEQSFNEIIKRHEVFRTTFTTVDGRPVQVITPSLHLSLAVEDLRALPQSEREAGARKLIQEAALYPFDLAHGPLLQVRLLRLREQEHMLLLTVHHIISDGWSMGVLARELGVLYDTFSHGRPSPLPDLIMQYADFAYWQHQWLHSEAGEAQLTYWTQQLKSPLTVMEFPTDRPRTGEMSLITSRQTFQFSKALTVSLTRLARQEGTTLFMTLMAAFHVLLYTYTEQEDLRVGTLLANRQGQETEELMGLFANLVVLRTNLSGNPTLREVLRRIRTTTLDAYAHQEIPFEHVVRALAHSRPLNRLSLFQVMFVMQNASQPLQLPPLKIDLIETQPLEATPCELVLSVRESPQGLNGVCIYKTALFDTDTITKILGAFQQILTDLIDQLEKPLSAIFVHDQDDEK